MTGFDSTSDKPDNNGIEKCCVQYIPQGIPEKPDPITVIQAREEIGKIEVLNIKFLLHHLH